MGTPRDFPLTFTGPQERTVPAVGRFVRVLAAPGGPVYVSFEGNEELQRTQGQDIDYGAHFKRLRVRSGVAQTVRLCVSDERQLDNSTTVNATVSATVAPGDTLRSVGDVSIGAASSAQIVAGDATRRAVTIRSRSSNTATIRIGESGGVGASRGHELDPGESVTLAASAAVWGYNTGAASQSVSVLEVLDV